MLYTRGAKASWLEDTKIASWLSRKKDNARCAVPLHSKLKCAQNHAEAGVKKNIFHGWHRFPGKHKERTLMEYRSSDESGHMF